MANKNSLFFPAHATALNYIISPITRFNDDDQLWETKIGTDQDGMPLHFTAHGKTERESRKRAKRVVKALVDKNICKFTHQIYKLTNPLNGEIFYVGSTTKSLELRLREHILASKHTQVVSYANEPKKTLIKSILDKNAIPIIECLEVIEGDCAEDSVIALQREKYWIDKLSDERHLLNVDYNKFRRSI